MSHSQIWAPWRLAYIETPKEENSPDVTGQTSQCFLCRYVSQPNREAENFVVLRGEHSISVLNRYPYNNGHLLVAPLAHKATLAELDDSELLECCQSLRRLTTIITQTMKCDGFNIGLNQGQVAGAGLPGHLHWHLVPRWWGDTNFMPVLADVNVIPQSLTVLYELLRKSLAET
ncbi:MAG: HIT domain-containing protein [Planctomycetales bacterium]|nr:HIT domain-containing protein [Planctomycetales bacterium]